MLKNREVERCLRGPISVAWYVLSCQEIPVTCATLVGQRSISKKHVIALAQWYFVEPAFSQLSSGIVWKKIRWNLTRHFAKRHFFLWSRAGLEHPSYSGVVISTNECNAIFFASYFFHFLLKSLNLHRFLYSCAHSVIFENAMYTWDTLKKI